MEIDITRFFALWGFALGAFILGFFLLWKKNRTLYGGLIVFYIVLNRIQMLAYGGHRFEATWSDNIGLVLLTNFEALIVFLITIIVFIVMKAKAKKVQKRDLNLIDSDDKF